MSKKMISAKKIIAVLVAMIMTVALVPAAMAATMTISSCTVIDDAIRVTASFEHSSAEHVIAIVTGTNKVASYADAVAFQYVQAAANEDVTFDILMPDELPTGRYKVTVGAPSTNTATATVTYMGYEERSRILNNLNADDADAHAVVSVLNASSIALDVAGSNNSYYAALPDESKIEFAQYIIDNRQVDEETGETVKFEKMSDIGSIANEALFITYFASESVSKDDDAAAVGYNEMFKNFVDDYEYIVFNLEDERYKKITNYGDFFAILRAQEDYAPNFDGIQKSIDAALTLERFNEIGWLEASEALADVWDHIPDKYKQEKVTVNNRRVEGITFDKLNKVTENSRIKGYFGDAAKSYGNVKTFDELIRLWDEAYTTAVDKYESYKSDKNTSSGPSGGPSRGPSIGDTTQTVVIDHDSIRSDPLGQKKLITDYYDDMAGYDWAAPAVLALTERGIVDGSGNNKFNPAGTLKREEFMKMLVNTFNLVDMTATCSFNDCDPNAWYYVYVASAEKAGITEGRGNGKFGVGEYVTREEVATMIYRLARSKGVVLPNSVQTVVYADNNDVSDYAKAAVASLGETGIMSGESDGRFYPKAGASRAQAAVAIYNISNLYNR